MGGKEGVWGQEDTKIGLKERNTFIFMCFTKVVLIFSFCASGTLMEKSYHNSSKYSLSILF